MTTLKSTQLDVGVLTGQLPVVSTSAKFTASLAANASTTLTLPAGTDPTLLIVDVTILDTFSAPSDPTYNLWIPGDVAVTVAKSATSIKLINEMSNAVQYTVVLR